MSRVVVSYSGGMDSTVLLYKAKQAFTEIFALAFNYGQRHIKELEYAQKNCDKLSIPLKIVDISFFKDIANTSSLTNTNINVAKVKEMMGEAQSVNYVPFRNTMLLSICSAYAESLNAETVWYGAAQADSVAGYWDGSSEFLERINSVNILNRKIKIKIEAPLITLSKEEIIKLGVSLKVDFKDCWTCYSGGEKPDGQCSACSLRIMGFISSHYKDSLQYEYQDKLDLIYKHC